MKLVALLLSLLCFRAQAEVYYEGTATFHGYGRVDLNWMLQFLPYNPVIIEIGAYTGDQVIYAAKVWPEFSKIIAFEPNPRAFDLLAQKVREESLDRVEMLGTAVSTYNGKALLYLCRGPSGSDLAYEYESSLLPPAKTALMRYQGPRIEVPCVHLDSWYRESGIGEIDILRLDIEGLELRTLKSSPEILKHVKILIVPSFFQAHRVGMANYFYLKEYLQEAGFVPLAHWYSPSERGLAVYISQELFDAYFVRCLGLGLGGLAYP